MRVLQRLLLIVAAAVTLLSSAGCVVESSSADLQAFAGYEQAEDSTLYRLADGETEQKLSMGDCSSDSEDALEEGQPCYWIKAYVTIGTVTVVDWVYVCNDTVTVSVPSDPVLIGLPITVEIPGVGKACGTVTP
jgi:hypothetical protein